MGATAKFLLLWSLDFSLPMLKVPQDSKSEKSAAGKIAGGRVLPHNAPVFTEQAHPFHFMENHMTNHEDRRNELKSQIHEAAEMLRGIFHQPSPPPAIGLDLDGTIDEAPEFFRTLSQCWPGEVYVITFRRDQAKAEQDVAKFEIQCDEVILVSSFAEKANVIAEKGISVYFDDQDEILMHIPENVTVLKIRNGGNYSYDLGKWLYSGETGRMI